MNLINRPPVRWPVSKSASEAEQTSDNEDGAKEAEPSSGEKGAAGDAPDKEDEAQEADVYEDETERDRTDDTDQTGGEIAASAYYSDHDLRQMFSRENAERRRQGSRMLRRLLTQAQDKKIMSQMVKIRDRYDVANSDDVILAWIQEQIAEGKADDYDPRLVELAQKVEIPERDGPFEPDGGH